MNLPFRIQCSTQIGGQLQKHFPLSCHIRQSGRQQDGYRDETVKRIDDYKRENRDPI